MRKFPKFVNKVWICCLSLDWVQSPGPYRITDDKGQPRPLQNERAAVQQQQSRSGLDCSSCLSRVQIVFSMTLDLAFSSFPYLHAPSIYGPHNLEICRRDIHSARRLGKSRIPPLVLVLVPACPLCCCCFVVFRASGRQSDIGRIPNPCLWAQVEAQSARWDTQNRQWMDCNMSVNCRHIMLLFALCSERCAALHRPAWHSAFQLIGPCEDDVANRIGANNAHVE